jgi:hypothetical protein
MRNPIIRPFVEIDSNSKAVLRKLRFRISELRLCRTRDNWLFVHCAWRAKKSDEWRFKYPAYGSRGFDCGGGQEATLVELEFDQVPAPLKPSGSDKYSIEYAKNNKASIQVGIYIRTGNTRNPPRLRYRYTHFEKTKFSACIWFAPDGWGEMETGDRPLFDWQSAEVKREQKRWEAKYDKETKS